MTPCGHRQSVLLAGELDQVDSIERHRTEVLAYLPNAEFKIIKGSGHLIRLMSLTR
jgi:hypothetical protein